MATAVHHVKLKEETKENSFVTKTKHLSLKESGCDPLFFIAVVWQIKRFDRKMAHPLVPQIIDLATPVAEGLGLEVVGVVFHTNQSPPVLRVDIRNPQEDTSLDDCERMSRALEAALDTANIIPDAYVLEISSPGVSSQLTTDRDFISFKGFSVLIQTSEPHEGKREWRGRLVGRDEQAVYVNQKGKAIAIPRSLITKVQLEEGR